MNCPGCETELPVLDDADDVLNVCEHCYGVAIDGAELNRFLLKNNLSGVHALGGRKAPEPGTATCRACGLDMALFENRDKENPLAYEICEDCGTLFVGEGFAEGLEKAAVQKALVAHIRTFTVKK